MSANPSTTASFIVTFMNTLGNFISWLGTTSKVVFESIGNSIASIAEFILKMFNMMITGITSAFGKAGDSGANAANETVLKETNMFVNFVVGIKDCIMYYLISPFMSMLNMKTASITAILFLILFILCIVGIILYVLFYFMTNIDTASKSLGIMFIVAVLIISAFLIFYRVYQNYNPSSDGSSSASSTLYKKIMVLIAIFICILIFVYANPLKQALDGISAFPVTIISIAIITLLVMSYNKFYFNKYSIQLAAFIILVAMGIYYNPFSIFTTHVVPSMIMVVTIISILILFMSMQQTRQDSLNAPENGQLTFIKFFSYAIVAGLMIGGGIYAHEHKTAISDPVFYILLVVTLAIIYKGMLWFGYTRNIPIITLLFDVIFYIPCILVDVIDYFSQAFLQTYSTTSKTMVILLIIEIALLLLYLIVPYMKHKLYKSFYIGENAHLLVNSPMRVNSENVIASYVDLNCPEMLTNDVVNPSNFFSKVKLDKNGVIKLKKENPKETCQFDYNYGLSIWFNMDAISPNAGAAYNEDTQIFKYGNKMVVKYNPSINRLTVNAQTLKTDNKGSTKNDERNETAVVYKNENVMLQKWNHLVINYSSGYVDVFLNGKLDGAKIQILPFMRNDSLIVGTGNGISGRVTGLIYFKHPMSAMSIKYMYEKFKTETPPKFPEDVSMFSTDIYKNSKYTS
jgi:hypothetical protein